MNIIEKIKKFVKEEYYKPTAKYGHEPYEHHIIPMVKYAENLAEELGADKEVVVLSGWLHDIGSCVYGREDHHLTGAQIAEEKLREFNYPIDKIELIKKCILNHRGSRCDERESLEEIIIAEADALSNFDNLPGIFKAAYVYENQEQDEARKTTLKKLQNKWNQLTLDKSKEMVRIKYEAVIILLGSAE